MSSQLIAYTHESFNAAKLEIKGNSTKRNGENQSVKISQNTHALIAGSLSTALQPIQR